MKLLLTGDSIIARHEGLSEPMLDNKLRQKLPDVQIKNTAVSGINSGAFFATINDLVIKQDKADYLVILLGTNDLATHKQVPLSQFKQNVGLIASSLLFQYRPHEVIFVSPPAVDEQKQHVRSNELVREYSQVIAEITAEYGYKYLNLYQAMLDRGNLPQLCQGMKNDGLHFGEAGYELLATLIKKALQ